MALDTPAPAKRLTAADIRVGMLARFAPPEWAVMWEVAEHTGAGNSRSADAVMMSLWPSRGLELHGVEIKVSRSDWRREAADPRKAEAIGKYCDRWWIHTAPGVINDLSEVPPLWGFREFNGKDWRTHREAGLNREPRACGRQFLAALLRRADGLARADAERHARDCVQAEREAIKEAIEKRVAQEVESKTHHHTALLKKVEDFEAASGLSITNRWGGEAGLGRAVALVQAIGVGETYGRLTGLRTTAAEIVRLIDEAQNPEPS